MTDPLAEAFIHLAETKPVFNKEGKRVEDPARVFRSFQDTFGDEDGQRCMTWICQEAGLFLNEGGQNEDVSQFMAGKRYMAQWILALYASPPLKPQPVPKAVSPLDRRK